MVPVEAAPSTREASSTAFRLSARTCGVEVLDEVLERVGPKVADRDFRRPNRAPTSYCG
jgi:hypothetical protein